eukprot:COSAG03_NODE_14703_length_455_cov_0.665730_2_plen_34_part_01
MHVRGRVWVWVRVERDSGERAVWCVCGGVPTRGR